MIGYSNGAIVAEDKDELVQLQIDDWQHKAEMAGINFSETHARYVAEVLFDAQLEHWNPVYEAKFDEIFAECIAQGDDKQTADTTARRNAYNYTNEDDALQDTLKEIESEAWKAAKEESGDE